ncbi:MAG TPA: high-potential iron-sulfur protein [Verrucomicrobiae bacterium]|nr:high-potential iron-sulfur protein [Verrucomicrobiae bacterium]
MFGSQDRRSRADFVRAIVTLPALGALLAAGTGVAEAKGSKAQFHYQTKPNGDKKCSNCALFIPGKTATADGTCKVVDGSISPNGYCVAYSPKSS